MRRARVDREPRGRLPDVASVHQVDDPVRVRRVQAAREGHEEGGGPDAYVMGPKTGARASGDELDAILGGRAGFHPPLEVMIDPAPNGSG